MIIQPEEQKHLLHQNCYPLHVICMGIPMIQENFMHGWTSGTIAQCAEGKNQINLAVYFSSTHLLTFKILRTLLIFLPLYLISYSNL